MVFESDDPIHIKIDHRWLKIWQYGSTYYVPSGLIQLIVISLLADKFNFPSSKYLLFEYKKFQNMFSAFMTLAL